MLPQESHTRRPQPSASVGMPARNRSAAESVLTTDRSRDRTAYPAFVIMAAAGVDVGHLSTWVLRGFAALSVGLILGARYRVISRAAREESGWAFYGAGAPLAMVLLSRDRAFLWYAATCIAAVGLSLLTIGRMPADMPSARDSACRSHPEYQRIARRGAIPSVVMLVLIAAGIVLSVKYIHGL